MTANREPRIVSNLVQYQTSALKRKRAALAHVPLTPHVALQRQRVKRAQVVKTVKPPAIAIPLATRPELGPEPVNPPINPEKVWATAKAQLKLQLDQRNYDRYIDRMGLVSFDPEKRLFTFGVSGETTCNALMYERSLKALISNCLSMAADLQPVSLQFMVRETNGKAAQPALPLVDLLNESRRQVRKV